jgi:peptide/nickel transport system permease protein
MRRYVLQRMLLLIPTLVGVSMVTFVLVRMVPGDPVLTMLGEHATGAEYAHLAKIFGLDQPVPFQYIRYAGRLLVGDWGLSIFGQEPVFPLVLRRALATLTIAVTSTVVSASVGILLGTIAALKRGSILDKTIGFVTLAAFSIPTFWVAIMFMLLFSVRLGWFPPVGRGLFLPTLTLAAASVGLLTRVTRISVVDSMENQIILTARAKGIVRRRIIFSQLLRVSLIPVVTIIGLQFGALIGGAVVTETVFNYPGLGGLIIGGLFARDYPIVQGAVLIAALIVALTNLVTDVLYTLLDPRIQFSRVSS